MSTSNHVIVTGLGRSGSTLLMAILTELGFDTGFDLAEPVHPLSFGGLEVLDVGPTSPYIVKGPLYCEKLHDIALNPIIDVDHVFIPHRDVRSSAASRVRVSALSDSIDPRDGAVTMPVPGGVWGTIHAGSQRAVLENKLGLLVDALVTHSLPHTYLAFPRFRTDPQYLFEQLSAYLRLDQSQLEDALTKVGVAERDHSGELDVEVPIAAAQPKRFESSSRLSRDLTPGPCKLEVIRERYGDYIDLRGYAVGPDHLKSDEPFHLILNSEYSTWRSEPILRRRRPDLVNWVKGRGIASERCLWAGVAEAFDVSSVPKGNYDLIVETGQYFLDARRSLEVA